MEAERLVGADLARSECAFSRIILGEVRRERSSHEGDSSLIPRSRLGEIPLSGGECRVTRDATRPRVGHSTTRARSERVFRARGPDGCPRSVT